MRYGNLSTRPPPLKVHKICFYGYGIYFSEFPDVSQVYVWTQSAALSCACGYIKGNASNIPPGVQATTASSWPRMWTGRRR